MPILLGAIADDLTGATDLAAMLSRRGLAVEQVLGLPQGEPGPGVQAVVVALKARTAPVTRAVAESLASCDWLTRHGAAQILFKYCSTFDSTDRGNIGPVALALMSRLGTDFTIVCPALPENGRTVRGGHLYVDGVPLADSPMRDHPLTPMRESDLRILLDRQTGPPPAELIPLAVVEQGTEAIANSFASLRASGARFGVVDAVTDDQLEAIGHACRGMRLVTGGSGVALGLPDNFRQDGLLREPTATLELPDLPGPVAILSGSGSEASRRQVEAAAKRVPAIRVDPIALADGTTSLESLFAEARAGLTQGAVLISATDTPERVAAIQERLGRAEAANLVESTLATLARRLVDSGVRKLIVAGGETSGAVAAALEVCRLRVGPEIAPGVPWTVRHEEPTLLLAFKSGNFGGPGFFLEALEQVA